MSKVEFKVIINSGLDSQKELDEFGFIEFYEDLVEKDYGLLRLLNFTAYCGEEVIHNIEVSNLYYLAHRADELDDKHEAYLSNLGSSFNGGDLFDQVNDDYVGEFDTAYDFITEHIGIEIPDCLKNHISYSRVFEAEFSDSYFRVNGHYFHNS